MINVVVAKKNPMITIKAFAKIAHQCPDATLRFAGNGALLQQSKNLVNQLELDAAIYDAEESESSDSDESDEETEDPEKRLHEDIKDMGLF